MELLRDPLEIEACGILGSKFHTPEGRIFIHDAAKPSRTSSNLVRIGFPSDLLPANMATSSGEILSNLIFSHCVFPPSLVNENTEEWLAGHIVKGKPTPKFWAYSRSLRARPRAVTFTERSDTLLINTSAIDPISRAKLISSARFKSDWVLPTYLNLIRTNPFVCKVKQILSLGLDVELAVTCPFLSEAERPNEKRPITFSSFGAFPVTRSNVDSVLSGTPTLNTLCIIFMGAFLLSQENAWFPEIK